MAGKYENAKQLSVEVSFEFQVVSLPAEQIFSYFTGYRENILSCAEAPLLVSAIQQNK